MIVILKSGVSDDQIQHVIELAERLGFSTHLSRGTYRTIVGLIGDETKVRAENLLAIPGLPK